MSTVTKFGEHLLSPFPIHRFTVEQYHRLGELGVLTPEDRVELLDGWIINLVDQRVECYLQSAGTSHELVMYEPVKYLSSSDVAEIDLSGTLISLPLAQLF